MPVCVKWQDVDQSEDRTRSAAPLLCFCNQVILRMPIGLELITQPGLAPAVPPHHPHVLGSQVRAMTPGQKLTFQQGSQLS